MRVFDFQSRLPVLLTPMLMGALLVPGHAQIQPAIQPADEAADDVAPVPAQVAKPIAANNTQPLIDQLRFQNIEVTELLGLLAKEFDVPIVINGEVEGRIKFINLTNQTADKAIRSVVRAAGLQLSKDTDGTYLITPRRMTADNNDAAMGRDLDTGNAPIAPNWGGAPVGSQVLDPLGAPAPTRTNASFSSVDDIPPLVQPTRKTRKRQYFIPIKNTSARIVAWQLDPINNPMPIEFKNSQELDKNYNQKYVGKSLIDPNDLMPSFSPAGMGGFGNPGMGLGFNPYLMNTQSNALMTEMRSNAQFGRGGGGGGFGNNNNGRGGNGRNGQGGGAFPLPEGIDRIVAVDPQNALLVFGNQEGLDELNDTVSFLDQPLRQVEIETQFVTVSTSDASAFGINFSTALGNFSASNQAFQPAPSNDAGAFTARFVKGNFQAALTTLLNTSRAKVITAPRVTAINNLTASITSTHSQPIQLNNVSQNINGNTQTGQNVFQILSTIGLFVTPTINNDDTVTMVLNPTVTTSTPSGLSSGAPIQDNQTVSTIANVRDGETIAMGGLKNKTISVGKSKIPILGDIPIIGKIFKARNKSDSESELIVFVTAHILHRVGDDDANAVLGNTN